MAMVCFLWYLPVRLKGSKFWATCIFCPVLLDLGLKIRSRSETNQSPSHDAWIFAKLEASGDNNEPRVEADTVHRQIVRTTGHPASILRRSADPQAPTLGVACTTRRPNICSARTGRLFRYFGAAPLAFESSGTSRSLLLTILVRSPPATRSIVLTASRAGVRSSKTIAPSLSTIATAYPTSSLISETRQQSRSARAHLPESQEPTLLSANISQGVFGRQIQQLHGRFFHSITQ